jgi:very-short-patch-repair endonuclease
VIVELDGEAHEEQEEKDEDRTERLRSLGYHVVRFENDDVKFKLENVLLIIGLACDGQDDPRSLPYPGPI